jgi:hypothetical protein
VPFENLSIRLGEDVPLDEDPLFDEIVTWRRGGYCYELDKLDGLLAALPHARLQPRRRLTKPHRLRRGHLEVSDSRTCGATDVRRE